MDNAHFELLRRASTALGQLSAVDQAWILKRLEDLAELPRSEWQARIVKRLDVATTLYVIPVDHSLRPLVAAPEGQAPEVVEIVRHETLQQYVTTE